MYLVILILFLLLIFYYIRKENFQVFQINNKYIKVKKNLTNYKKAEIILNEIDKQILTLINQLELKYIINDNEHYNKKLLINSYKLLKKRYKSKNLYENFPKNKDEDTSYTISKGKIISICLRSIKNKKFHNLNDIIFVVIHELAHISNNEYGHGIKFWKIFKILLEESIYFNLYNPVDYSIYPVRYCGMMITYNPIYDNSLI